MSAAPTALVPSFADLAAFLILFARTAGLFHALPLVGDRAPAKVRVAAAVVLALALAPARPPTADPIADPGRLFALLPLELALGLGAGLFVRLMMGAAEAGGQLIGLSLQLGFAGTFDPASREEALPTRRLALTFGALAFLGANGLEAVLRVVLSAPLTDTATVRALGGALLRSAVDVMPHAVALAAPVVVTALVINATVAITSRAAPSLNVFSLVLAAVLLAGAVVNRAGTPALFGQLAESGRRVAPVLAKALRLHNAHSR